MSDKSTKNMSSLMELDIKDINWREIYLMGRNVHLSLGILLFIIILLISYFFVFSGKLSELKNLKSEESNLKSNYEKNSEKLKILPYLEKEIKTIEESFSFLLKELPETSEVPDFIQEIYKVGVKNGLKINSVIPVESNIDGSVRESSYSISTKGTYNQLVDFVRDISSLNRIIVLDNIKLEIEKSEMTEVPQLRLSVHAKTYQTEKIIAKKEEK